eukprot:321425_1
MAEEKYFFVPVKIKSTLSSTFPGCKGGSIFPQIMAIGSGGDIKHGAVAKAKSATNSSELAVELDIDRLKSHSKHKIYGTIICKGKVGKTESVKSEIIDFFKSKQEQDVWCIYYTGHGNRDGDWCFYDGRISFGWILHAFKQNYKKHFGGIVRLHIVSDCCYSGKWVDAASKAYKNLPYAVFVEVDSAAGSQCVAKDNVYSSRWSNECITKSWIKLVKQYGAKFSCDGEVKSYDSYNAFV